MTTIEALQCLKEFVEWPIRDAEPGEPEITFTYWLQDIAQDEGETPQIRKDIIAKIGKLIEAIS